MNGLLSIVPYSQTTGIMIEIKGVRQSTRQLSSENIFSYHQVHNRTKLTRKFKIKEISQSGDFFFNRSEA